MLCLSGFELYSRWVPLTRYHMAYLARNLTAVQNATAQVASCSPKFCYFKTVRVESLVRSDLITPN